MSTVVIDPELAAQLTSNGVEVSLGLRQILDPTDLEFDGRGRIGGDRGRGWYGGGVHD